MRKPCNEHMSAALPPIADIAQHDCDGREVPFSAICSAANETHRLRLFDHVVGELLKLQRHVEVEGLCGLEIDDGLELRWMLYGQIGRFGAAK